MPITVSLESKTDLAPGRYDAVVDTLEEKQGQKQPYIRMGFEIANGPSAGRKVWTNRSWDLFKPLLIALRQIDPTDSRKTWTGELDDLLYQPVVIDVDLRGGGNGYDPKLEPVAIYDPQDVPAMDQPVAEIPFDMGTTGQADPLFPDVPAGKVPATTGAGKLSGL